MAGLISTSGIGIRGFHRGKHLRTVEKLRLYMFPKTIYESADKDITVVDRMEQGEPVRVLFSQGVRESGMYLEESRKKDPLFFYMRTFKDICTRYDGIHEVLMIGGAGLTFARVFLSIHQENTMTVVEKDKRFIDIADRYFDIRENERLKVRIMPGEKFISEAVQHGPMAEDMYDAIIIDAFDGNRIAKELTSDGMLKMAHALLAPDGLFIMNAINEKGGHIAMHTYLTEELLKKIFSNTQIIQCENEGNCVLMATNRKIILN